MKIKFLLFLSLSLSVSLSAQKFPFLKVGNMWHFVYANSETGEEVPVTIHILSESDAGFEVMETRGEKDKDPSFSIWFIDGDFLKEYKKGTDKSSAWVLMKTNVAVGDKWESNLGFEKIIFEVSEINKVIYTHAGRFDSYEVLVKSSSGSVLYTTYFNERVGPLRGSSAFNKGELVSINF